MIIDTKSLDFSQCVNPSVTICRQQLQAFEYHINLQNNCLLTYVILGDLLNNNN